MCERAAYMVRMGISSAFLTSCLLFNSCVSIAPGTLPPPTSTSAPTIALTGQELARREGHTVASFVAREQLTYAHAKAKQDAVICPKHKTRVPDSEICCLPGQTLDDQGQCIGIAFYCVDEDGQMFNAKEFATNCHYIKNTDDVIARINRIKAQQLLSAQMSSAILNESHKYPIAWHLKNNHLHALLLLESYLNTHPESMGFLGVLIDYNESEGRVKITSEQISYLLETTAKLNNLKNVDVGVNLHALYAISKNKNIKNLKSLSFVIYVYNEYIGISNFDILIDNNKNLTDIKIDLGCTYGNTLKQLSKSKILRKAERITFSRNSLDCEFDQNSVRLPYILKNTNFKNLKHLDLSRLARFNGIFEAISKNNTLQNLESLDLSHKIDRINHANSTWPNSIKYLAKANLDKLKHLDMSRDLGENTTDSVFTALSGAKWFKRLEKLKLSEMSISNSTMDLLINRVKWKGLKHLDLSDSNLHLDSLERLMKSSMVDEINFLDLSYSYVSIGTATNKSLMSSDQCERLLTAHIDGRSVSCKNPTKEIVALTNQCVFRCND